MDLNLELSFLSVRERGNIVPKTPEATLVAAQAYLLNTQPTPGDVREGMHRAAIQGLGLVGDKCKRNPCGKEDHRVIAIAPSRAGKVTDLDLHTIMKHHGLIIAA